MCVCLCVKCFFRGERGERGEIGERGERGERGREGKRGREECEGVESKKVRKGEAKSHGSDKTRLKDNNYDPMRLLTTPAP